jgi:hypothetical protein
VVPATRSRRASLRPTTRRRKAAETLAAAATAVEGRVLEEGGVSGTAAAVRSAVGTGPTTPRRTEENRQALMPYVALLTIIPLGFVLYRRNL